MKICQNCKEEYESSSPVSKFCSVKCRVAWHRKHPRAKKSIGVPEIELIYNKVVGLLDAMPTGFPTISSSPQPPTIPANRIGEYRNRLRECGSIREITEVMMDIKSDSSVHFRDKQTLENYARERSQDMF